jgi:chromosomal replication initiation ATPase DnaA
VSAKEAAAASQLALDFGHRAALGAADFLVVPGNSAAVAWVDRWPDWPSPAVALYGPPGCGKSHLANVWRARSGAVSIDPERLADGSAGADIPGLLEGGRHAVIDGASGIAERPLLHLFNMVAEAGGSLLLTAVQPPARWAIGLADLRSRLLACPAVAIEPADDGLIAAVLVKLFADRQLAIGEDVVLFLLGQMERSFEAARRVVALLDEEALATHRRITVPLVRAVLRRLAVRPEEAPEAP